MSALEQIATGLDLVGATGRADFLGELARHIPPGSSPPMFTVGGSGASALSRSTSSTIGPAADAGPAYHLELGGVR